jgi:hypothetical protein
MICHFSILAQKYYEIRHEFGYNLNTGTASDKKENIDELTLQICLTSMDVTVVTCFGLC